MTIHATPFKELRFDGLRRDFGTLNALRDISLTIKQGEFIALLGPSGCGKSTTLNILAGLLPATGGGIWLDEKRIDTLRPEQRGFGMVFQNYALFPHMTVRKNIGFGLMMQGVSKPEIARRVDEAIALVRLQGQETKLPGQLSGGQQQRVAIARAVVIEPPLVLMDEPLSNLDANLREEMRFEIRRLHDEFRITTVYVTHDQSEAMVTSDRIVVMNAGRIEQVDDPVSLYTRPQTRFVAGFIGRTNFLDGIAEAGQVVFAGATVPAALLPQPVSGPVSFSVRPGSIGLHPTRGDDATAWWIEGTVTERAYLGEYWDYVVRPTADGTPIRVTAPPSQNLAVGDPIWLSIDPATIAQIPA